MKRNLMLPSHAFGTVEKLFQDLAHGLGAGTSDGRRFLAAMDLFASEDGWQLAVDLPGVAEEDVELTLEEGVLELSAERHRAVPDGHTLSFGERADGRFVRRFRVPGEVDTAGIEARLEDGVLFVTLPKAPESKAKRIDVRRA